MISVRTCGGGGYGAARGARPGAGSCATCCEGKVSAERARDLYRVAVDLETRELDSRTAD